MSAWACTQNDPDLVRSASTDWGLEVAVGLSQNRERAAYRISGGSSRAGKPIIPGHPAPRRFTESQGLRPLADISGPGRQVVDCFVNFASGAVVDDIIAQGPAGDRRGLDAGRCRRPGGGRAGPCRAGLHVVMDTCPKLEWPRLETPRHAALLCRSGHVRRMVPPFGPFDVQPSSPQASARSTSRPTSSPPVPPQVGDGIAVPHRGASRHARARA